MNSSKPVPVNWKLNLSYDGTNFHGWQVQPGCATIQGELAGAIDRVTAESVLPQGSGRTDAGVHALGQVASFQLNSPIPAASLLRALNRALPASIRILSAEIAASEFHARHSAIGKTYEYRIYRGKICPPFLAPYVYALNWPLDVEAMQRAAKLICGAHDFTSFAAVDPDVTHRPSLESAEALSLVRTICESVWTQESEWTQAGELENNELLIYRVRGNGFLHHMVRNLVGTFLEVGRGRMLPDRMTGILNERSRSAAGPTAPARGLYLVSVDY